MPVLALRTDAVSLEAGVRSRRIWYHNIDLPFGLQTRFPEDYEANPVLRAVDRANADLEAWTAEVLPSGPAGRYVLDLGCADGLHTLTAARRGAAHVVAMERNRYNLDRAEWLADTLALENIEFRWGNVERECPDGVFDLVLCIGLIYHLVNPLGTLAMIRSRCTGTLVLTSAIDLPEGDGSPMSRLDRYATGAHGVWSFNVSMVRQMLVTAGFEIEHEKVIGGDGAGGYLVVARPGDFHDHHIFAAAIEQEFPINVERRRQTVRAVWRELADQVNRPVALFGAGTHTPWLLDQVADLPGVEVSCVLDDRIHPAGTVANLPVRRPADIDPESVGAIVLSSWHQTEVLRLRALAVFGDRVKIVTVDGSEHGSSTT